MYWGALYVVQIEPQETRRQVLASRALNQMVSHTIDYCEVQRLNAL